MRLPNPLEISDWGMRRFLVVILSLQFSILGLIAWGRLGIEVPLVRPFLGFIYLTFVPGAVALRILKLHSLGSVRSVLYTVGISLAILMFTGLIMTAVFPYFGVADPISLTNLILTLAVVLVGMCLLCFWRDREFCSPTFLESRILVSPAFLSLLLIVVLTVLGTTIMNLSGNSFLLLIVVLMISAVVIMIGTARRVPKTIYPVAVWSISMALLFHTSLISNYLAGWDIQFEYYLSHLVVSSSHWTPTFPNPTNGMLDIVILAPMYSLVCNTDLIWVLKIVYPFIFSFVPVGLYHLYQVLSSEKAAFFSVIFFMSTFAFFTAMVEIARQEIAELFLVLILVLFFGQNGRPAPRSILLVVFGSSLVVSHYGLSYLFLVSLVVVVVFARPKKVSNTRRAAAISPRFVLLFGVTVFSWYTYVAASSSLNSVVKILQNIAYSISGGLFNPETAEGLAFVLESKLTPLHMIAKYLYLFSQFLLVLGFFVSVLSRKNREGTGEYNTLAAVFLSFLVACIAIPFFADSLNTNRMYQIGLILLSPYVVIGWSSVIGRISRMKLPRAIKAKPQSSSKSIVFFFVILLLFNTGFIYHVANDNPTSISFDDGVDYPRFSNQEVIGAQWMFSAMSGGQAYADQYRWLLLGSIDWFKASTYPPDLNQTPSGSYLFFGAQNVYGGRLLLNTAAGYGFSLEYFSALHFIESRDRLYANGQSEVFV